MRLYQELLHRRQSIKGSRSSGVLRPRDCRVTVDHLLLGAWNGNRLEEHPESARAVGQQVDEARYW